MKFNVNFYIHIFKQPMFIIKNFDKPTRDIHLSYHEGQHYNSVRLIADNGSSPPSRIPLEILGISELCLKETSTAKVVDYDLIAKSKVDEKEGDNNLDIFREELEKLQLDEVLLASLKLYDQTQLLNEQKILELKYKGYNIKDIKDLIENEKDDLDKKLITHYDGEMYDEYSDYRKCHCNSNKKYKSCCKNLDIIGTIKGDNLYCDITKFKSSKAFEILKSKIDRKSRLSKKK